MQRCYRTRLEVANPGQGACFAPDPGSLNSVSAATTKCSAPPGAASDRRWFICGSAAASLLLLWPLTEPGRADEIAAARDTVTTTALILVATLRLLLVLCLRAPRAEQCHHAPRRDNRNGLEHRSSGSVTRQRLRQLVESCSAHTGGPSMSLRIRSSSFVRHRIDA